MHLNSAKRVSVGNVLVNCTKFSLSEVNFSLALAQAHAAPVEAGLEFLGVAVEHVDNLSTEAHIAELLPLHLLLIQDDFIQLVLAVQHQVRAAQQPPAPGGPGAARGFGLVGPLFGAQGAGLDNGLGALLAALFLHHNVAPAHVLGVFFDVNCDVFFVGEGVQGHAVVEGGLLEERGLFAAGKD